MSEPTTSWATRTPADLSSLLLELARALRGLAFYGETDPGRGEFVDRAFRAFESELTRAGPIDLRIDPSGFRLEGLETPVSCSGVLGEVAQILERHQIERLRFEATLTRHALHALLDLLLQQRGRFETPQHFLRALTARTSTGIEINDLLAEADVHRPKLSATPPRVSASLRPEIADVWATPPPAIEDDTIPSEQEKPSLDHAPLQRISPDDRGERLRLRLIELDGTLDDGGYASLATDIVRWSEELGAEGLADECYRALLVFADHAVGMGGRSERQARTALASFTTLANEERIDDLIDRACGASMDSGVRAAQLLLQLGNRAAPRVFERICQTQDQERIGPLQSLILAFGNASLPTLSAAIDGQDDHRARVGIRLAGELQSPTILPVLLRAVSAPDLGRRLETLRALSFLPGEDSKAALEAALDSDLDEIVVAATSALATTDGQDAVPTLLDVLEASVHRSRTSLCCELIQILGTLADERSVPRLAAILERKPLIRRAHWHAIQLSAADALANLPTKEAKRALEKASKHAATPVRARAKKRLDEARPAA